MRLHPLGSKGWQSQFAWLLLGVGLWIVLDSAQPILEFPFSTSAFHAKAEPGLPPLQVHPLPSSLAQWQAPDISASSDTPSHPIGLDGDYFTEISPTPAGYLIWSQFPIQVYVEPAGSSPSMEPREEIWVQEVTQAIQEWNRYLPLEIVDIPEGADILVWHTKPPLAAWGDSEGSAQVRAAETRYELYLQPSGESEQILLPRFSVAVGLGQSDHHIRASARHELGHALGIWGYSLEETDALYFSQVQEPPPISTRDIRTLKRVYEQPTRLGWPFPVSQEQQEPI